MTSLLMAPAAAAAQTLVPTTPTLVEEVDAAPRPGQTGASGTIGMQLQTGRTDTKGWTVNLVAAHTTEHRDLLRLDVESNFGSYRLASGQPYTEIEDNQRATFTYIRPLPHRLALLGLGAWRRDFILDLTYRLEVEGGMGVALVENKKAYLLAGASFSVGHESRGFTDANSAVRDLGFLQVATYHVTPVLSAAESLVLKTDVGDGDDRTSTLNVSFAARVSKHVGMKVYYQHQYDSLHQPTVTASQSQFGAGVQVSFGAKTSTP